MRLPRLASPRRAQTVCTPTPAPCTPTPHTPSPTHPQPDTRAPTHTRPAHTPPGTVHECRGASLPAATRAAPCTRPRVLIRAQAAHAERPN